MAFIALTTAETDAKSPLDDALFLKIKDNFDDLNSRVIAAGAAPFVLELQGRLTYITDTKRSVCSAIVNKEFVPLLCRFILKKSGTSGTLAFDIRKHTMPKTAITGIDHQYTAATSSISIQGSALNTQSIARATAQISTQSISHAKAAKNVLSIILLGDVEGLGNDMVQYNLDATIDSDTLVGDFVTFASCATAANNGSFPIADKNRGGGFNIVVKNPNGVAQVGTGGTSQEKIMAYTFLNPVDTLFTPTYTVDFASHTDPLNDGDFTIYAINQAGNNIWIKNPVGVTQGGVAGTANTNLWKFNLSGAASTTDYIVGEAALTASHSSSVNNGDLTIVGVNVGGNNLVLHNASGTVQGGVAGTINTNRFAYNLPTDPTSQVSVSDTVYFSGHTSSANDGTFTVKAVTSSTIVVYNTSGVVQGGSAGNVYTTRKLVKFAADQSANYTTDSYIEMQGLSDKTYNYYYSRAPFRVLQVNRGGGANYNVVIDHPTGLNQESPAGYVQVEMKSIFTTTPSLTVDVTAQEPNQNIKAVSTDLSATTIPVQTPLMLYITEHMEGDPRDLTVILL
ncbi:MAG: hypothetical protein BWY68_00519 [bacterium ADurb.Bin400]|nr:MAG: hypothetical protein BWY68_00519 [bacterium ADurb.Bin400]